MTIEILSPHKGTLPMKPVAAEAAKAAEAAQAEPPRATSWGALKLVYR